MTVGTMEKRRRRAAPAPAPRATASRGWIWAVLQLSVLAIEVFFILFLLAQPAFRPTDLELKGIQHVSTAEVTTALALPEDRNIFFLNHADLERRVETLPWVRSASVGIELPNRVSVSVTEWRPSAVLQVGEASYYLNGVGEVLDPANEAGQLPVINRSDYGAVKDGQQAIAGDLLTMLGQLRAGFNPAFKVSITSFSLDRREVLTAQTDRGWIIIFGQMVTSDDRQSLEPKLAALRALSSRVDLTSKQILYVNLENPGAPAVQMRGCK